MTGGTPESGDNPWSPRLVQDDLPTGWRLVTSIDDQLVTTVNAAIGVDDRAEEWQLVESSEAKIRVAVRLQQMRDRVPQEIRVTGVVVLPSRDGQPVTGAMISRLPVARIEIAVNNRLFTPDVDTTTASGRVLRSSGRILTEEEVLAPISAVRYSDEFYDHVALQLQELSAHTQTSKAPALLAQINGVGVSTAQAWIADTRRRGLLPPGRRGRLATPSSSHSETETQAAARIAAIGSGAGGARSQLGRDANSTARRPPEITPQPDVGLER